MRRKSRICFTISTVICFNILQITNIVVPILIKITLDSISSFDKMYSRITWKQDLLHHHQVFQKIHCWRKIYAFQDTLWNYRFYEKYFFSSSFNHLFVNSKNSISLLFPCVCKLLVGNGKVRYNIKANHAHTHNCNSCKHLWDMLCLSY